jgi:Mg-chelatase subunit ChlI
MNLGRTYNEEDYEEAITVVGLCHEERRREIEHEKKLDEAWSKTDKGKGKNSSKPESSNHKGDSKKPYDKGQKKIQFSDPFKSKDKDELKWTHHNKEKALKVYRLRYRRNAGKETLPPMQKTQPLVGNL